MALSLWAQPGPVKSLDYTFDTNVCKNQKNPGAWGLEPEARRPGGQGLGVGGLKGAWAQGPDRG